MITEFRKNYSETGNPEEANAMTRELTENETVDQEIIEDDEMGREITVRELVDIYDGVLIDVNREDVYGVGFDLRGAKIVYDEMDHELLFDGEGYDVAFNFYDDYEPFESIYYNEKTQETFIEFNGYMPPITIGKSIILTEEMRKKIEKLKNPTAE